MKAPPVGPPAAAKVATRQRLIQHLDFGSMDCLQVLRAMVEPLHRFQIEELNMKDAEERRSVNASGRRTVQQKREQERLATECIEDITGKWDDPLKALTQDEMSELDDLYEWMEKGFLDEFLQADNIEKLQSCMNDVEIRAALFMSPKVALYWMDMLLTDTIKLFSEGGSSEEARCLIASTRNKVMARWRDR